MKMTKADLIKEIEHMPDDAEVYFDTRRNELDLKSIRSNDHKNVIWFEFDYAPDDDDENLLV